MTHKGGARLSAANKFLFFEENITAPIMLKTQRFGGTVCLSGWEEGRRRSDSRNKGLRRNLKEIAKKELSYSREMAGTLKDRHDELVEMTRKLPNEFKNKLKTAMKEAARGWDTDEVDEFFGDSFYGGFKNDPLSSDEDSSDEYKW